MAEFNDVNRELQSALQLAMASMKSLNAHDRAMVLTAIGAGGGAVAAGTGFGVLAGQAALIAAEGGFNPISVGIGGALFVGGVVASALQAERFTELHADRVNKYNDYKRKHQVYAMYMGRFFDTTAEMNSQPLNVSTKQLVQITRETYGFALSQLSDWWQSTFDTTTSTSSNYATA